MALRSDEALYEQLLQGDLRAFDALYERYERPLLGFIRVHLRDTAEAEDVLHDAFLAVLREGRAGRQTQSFKPWLFQVARNLCLNRARARERGERAVAVVAQSAPAGFSAQLAVEKREAAAALSAAVGQLPSGLAELYRLRSSGLSYDELAQVLGVPLGTIKSRLHELVGRLRQEVSK